ncbi:P-loop containing nucleoside triphosphate hydrolase protein [Flagelloscypha sp. PMI_526]|nr:P-loop containing nucleoside triphosphate hydrolase protein [Flagelloscypha sp. PMI_526]
MPAKPLKKVSQMKPKQPQIFKQPVHGPWVETSPNTHHIKKRPFPPTVVNGGSPAKKRRITLNREDTTPHTFPSPKQKKQMQASSVIQEQRKQLPIAAGKDALINEIAQHDVTVIVGETGSGKTTQVPQYILDSGLSRDGLVGITQPRRVAATSLADRVAKEQETRLGEIVGYSVRFDEKSGPSTRIKYLTDGMIVREMLSDRSLSKYSVIIVDEAHERSLRTDLLLANLKEIVKERRTSNNVLKVVIMSATLDAEKFAAFFPGSKVIYVQGRQHPVTILHSASPQHDYVQAAMRTFFQIHLERPPGDVLIFLPGQEDIEDLEGSIKLFANRLPHDNMIVLLCPMFAAQAHAKNAKVFEPAPENTRKCILATNIAETSITIPGVKFVIDTGKCKENRYLSAPNGSGLDTLMTHNITQSSAMQRAGRAGREVVFYVLLSGQKIKKLPASPQPEILRVNLSSSMLQLKAMGFDVEKLDLMDKPDTNAVRSALVTLFYLNALDQKLSLTPLGKQMAGFPLDPMYSRALLASQDYGCTSEIIDIISVLSASSKLFHAGNSGHNLDDREKVNDSRSKFSSLQGDHCRALNVFRAYEDLCAQQQQQHGHGGSTKKEQRKERLDWCHAHWINERALIEAKDIRTQLQEHCERTKPRVDWTLSVRTEDVEAREQKIARALAHGLVANSAMLHPNGEYKQCMGQTVVKIHPSSVLAGKKVSCIVFDELVFTSNIYARGVSRIEKHHLRTLGIARQINT